MVAKYRKWKVRFYVIVILMLPYFLVWNVFSKKFIFYKIKGARPPFPEYWETQLYNVVCEENQNCVKISLPPFPFPEQADFMWYWIQSAPSKLQLLSRFHNPILCLGMCLRNMLSYLSIMCSQDDWKTMTVFSWFKVNSSVCNLDSITFIVHI